MNAGTLLFLPADLPIDVKTLIVVTGPTASGKTGLSIALANHFASGIINADSRQIYREMSIGTARPTEDELQLAPHFLFGHVSIHTHYSAGDYERDAEEMLQQLFEKSNYVVVCGGTGLYLNALIHGFDDVPQKDDALRAELQELFDQSGIQALTERLQKIDPEFVPHVDIHNPHRVMRAIEIATLSGKSNLEIRQGKKKQQDLHVISFMIDHPREVLYNRINQRVDEMVSTGLKSEAESLYPHKNLKALQTVGYSEWFDFFDGKITEEKAIELIKQHTRNYAKRQLTWFRRDEKMHRLHPEHALEEAISCIEKEVQS
jgi:tRNA dimethylallyltransferase